MEQTRTKINQKIIAEEAGVSIMTVSRVLRGTNDVSEETRKEILRVADKHRYRPNLLVRGMQTGKTKTIGVIIPSREYDYRILSGVHDELMNADYIPYTIWGATDAVDKTIDAHELKQIHRLVDRRVDGIILKPVNEWVNDEYLKEIWERHIPLVVVDREMKKTHADFVGSDDYLGGQIAARHLLNLGHKTFAHLAGENSVVTFKSRRDGFCDTLAEHESVSCTTMEIESVESPAMEQFAKALLTQTPRPTAIFTPVDSVCIAVYSIARKLGISIPEDISVIGFGNLSICKAMCPTLTSIEQSPYQIGRIAASMILQRTKEKTSRSEPSIVRVKPELVIRESTQYLKQ
jgi:LacI family transcriptional regulator